MIGYVCVCFVCLFVGWWVGVFVCLLVVLMCLFVGLCVDCSFGLCCLFVRLFGFLHAFVIV